jgi:hypothetical protein
MITVEKNKDGSIRIKYEGIYLTVYPKDIRSLMYQLGVLNPDIIPELAGCAQCESEREADR